MHVTACLAKQTVAVEVGEECRTTQALREAIVAALPQLCVDGFDVSVGGRELDDEGVVSLEEGVRLDVSANARVLSVSALREAGREVSEEGLLDAASQGDVGLCTLYLDAGVPIDCVHGAYRLTLLHLSCGRYGNLELATLLLDRGAAIDATDFDGKTPLHYSCDYGHAAIATLLLDRGSTAIDETQSEGRTPLYMSCDRGHVEIVRLLLDRGSAAIDEEASGWTPLFLSCIRGHVDTVRLLLDRGSAAQPGETDDIGRPFKPKILALLSNRISKQPPARPTRRAVKKKGKE